MTRGLLISLHLVRYTELLLARLLGLAEVKPGGPGIRVREGREIRVNVVASAVGSFLTSGPILQRLCFVKSVILILIIAKLAGRRSKSRRWQGRTEEKG